MIAWLARLWERNRAPALTDAQRAELAASVMVATAQLEQNNHTVQLDAGFNWAAGRLLIGVHPVTLTAACVTARMKHRHTEGRCLQCSYQDGVMSAIETWKARKP